MFPLSIRTFNICLYLSVYEKNALVGPIRKKKFVFYVKNCVSKLYRDMGLESLKLIGNRINCIMEKEDTKLKSFYISFEWISWYLYGIWIFMLWLEQVKIYEYIFFRLLLRKIKYIQKSVSWYLESFSDQLYLPNIFWL